MLVTLEVPALGCSLMFGSFGGPLLTAPEEIPSPAAAEAEGSFAGH